MTPVRIPKDIDAPPQVFIFEIDEFIVLVGLLFAGLATGRVIIALLLMYPAYAGMRRLKAIQSRGIALHALYWVGLVSKKFRPDNGQDREFTGG